MITVHCIVKNEEVWLWYALQAVLPYVDRVLLCDTGSTDNTRRIIQAIHDPKIIFKEKGEIDAWQMVKLQQELVDQTKEGWILLLGGDEIWTDEAIRELSQKTKKLSPEVWAIGVKFWYCLGDIYHFDPKIEKQIASYNPQGQQGFWGFHCLSKNIPGLQVKGVYGFERYVDAEGTQIHQFSAKRLSFLKNPVFHTTHLKRSNQDKLVMQRANKRRYELGKPFGQEQVYPKIFYQNHPDLVPSVLTRFSVEDRLRGLVSWPYRSTKNWIWQRTVWPKIQKAQQNRASDEELAKLVGVK